MDKSQIDGILRKLAKSKATAEEKQAFTEWLNELSQEEYERILNQYQVVVHQIPSEEKDMVELKQKIESHLGGQRKMKRLIHFKSLRDVAAVGVVLLIALAGSWYFINTQFDNSQIVDEKTQFTSQYGDDILPGGDKAILTLSDGKKIILDDTPEGELKVGNGIRIQKTGEGEIVYDFFTEERKPSTPVTFNTISTPKGGEYKVTLPDGSRVWLNSESSITCPTLFDEKERIVYVNGEVYFEVAEMTSLYDAQKIPFIVRTGNQSIEVLGTQFNIKAYSDMERMETTLVEGQVMVYTPLEKALLTPGEQVKVANNGELEVTDHVDISKVVAWKNGYFQFSDDLIQDVMQQLIRWYDVEVEYKGGEVKDRFGGEIARSKNLSEVLRILALTGAVHFRIDGRRVEVFGK